MDEHTTLRRIRGCMIQGEPRQHDEEAQVMLLHAAYVSCTSRPGLSLELDLEMPN
jgi:hypothetical protein